MRWHQLLVKRLGEARADHEKSLLNGRASDFTDYKYLVGMISGLKLAAEIADEIESQVMKE